MWDKRSIRNSGQCKSIFKRTGKTCDVQDFKFKEIEKGVLLLLLLIDKCIITYWLLYNKNGGGRMDGKFSSDSTNCTNKRRISRFANYMERAARSQKTWDTVRLSPIFCNSDWEAV